jgi:hypothetical protein
MNVYLGEYDVFSRLGKSRIYAADTCWSFNLKLVHFRCPEKPESRVVFCIGIFWYFGVWMSGKFDVTRSLVFRKSYAHGNCLLKARIISVAFCWIRGIYDQFNGYAYLSWIPGVVLYAAC